MSFARRLLAITSVIIAAFAFLALVALSPLALRLLARWFGLNWAILSNVGQTYGAVSALITALALGGVALSLLYQARDVGAARSQAIRTFVFDLLRLELDDEVLARASGAPWGYAIPADFGGLREHIFVHMWLLFWEDQFLLHEMSARDVRLSARELFCARPGRAYWEQVGNNRLSSSAGRVLRFLRIVDEEYRNAIGTPPVTTGAAETAGRPGVSNRRGGPAVICACAATAVAAGVLAMRQMYRRKRAD